MSQANDSNLNLSLFYFRIGTLKTLIGLVAPDKSVKEICEKGDQLLLEETSKVHPFVPINLILFYI